MAASPKYKIYDVSNEYIAACKYPTEAAVLMAFLGAGASVRLSTSVKSILWLEGENYRAGESYDFAAYTIIDKEKIYLSKV